MGPPRAICSRNLGMTLPVLPSTFPKRTTTKRVPLACCSAWQTCSDRRLIAPGARQAQRPEDVVLRRFPGIVDLHERHVLVGSGVEYDRRFESGENSLESRRIAHVGDYGRNVRPFWRRQEFLFDGVQGVLILIEQDQACRLEFRDLAGEF